MLSYVMTLWMLNEKSEITFCSGDTWVKILHVYFICQDIFSYKWQVYNSSQLQHRVGVYWFIKKRKTGGVKRFQWLLCQDTIRTCSQGENWLNCGDGVEKSFSIRRLVWKPEARKGEITGSSSLSFSGI